MCGCVCVPKKTNSMLFSTLCDVIWLLTIIAIVAPKIQMLQALYKITQFYFTLVTIYKQEDKLLTFVNPINLIVSQVIIVALKIRLNKMFVFDFFLFLLNLYFQFSYMSHLMCSLNDFGINVYMVESWNQANIENHLQ